MVNPPGSHWRFASPAGFIFIVCNRPAAMQIYYLLRARNHAELLANTARLMDPGTTTVRRVSGSVVRSNRPAGRTHVRNAANTIIDPIRSRGSIVRCFDIVAYPFLGRICCPGSRHSEPPPSVRNHSSILLARWRIRAEDETLYSVSRDAGSETKRTRQRTTDCSSITYRPTLHPSGLLPYR